MRPPGFRLFQNPAIGCEVTHVESEMNFPGEREPLIRGGQGSPHVTGERVGLPGDEWFDGTARRETQVRKALLEDGRSEISKTGPGHRRRLGPGDEAAHQVFEPAFSRVVRE